MSERANNSRGARRGIASLASTTLLKKMWKRYLRYDLQNPRLQEFELGHDPLEYLPIEWDLDAVVQDLSSSLKAGTYRPGQPEVVRSAKGSGLTRPLAFLGVEDLIVYKTILQVARSSLKAYSKPWTSFGRGDPSKPGTQRAGYSWFVLWLLQDKRRWEIIASSPFIVITDIANFFPYVPVTGVASHVLNHSNLDEPAVHLLMRMLEEFGQVHSYRRTASIGLPQEGFDCSRILAHTYLTPLDEEFQSEGKNGRYTRHVDDIFIGVGSEDEGFRAISRVQSALEGLGLYPNAAKTEILSTTAISTKWFRDTNDYLGEVERRQTEDESENLSEFQARFEDHFERADRHRYWSQVLKRFISISRRLRADFLCDRWTQVIEQAPEAARHMFDYLSTFPLTVERVREVKEYTHRNWGLYEDIDLLIHEYICAAPNEDERELRTEIGEWALPISRQEYSNSPRRASASLLSVGKFGTQDQILRLVPLLDQARPIDHVARRQLAVVLAGSRHYTPEQLSERLPNPSRDASRHLRFLRAIRTGDRRATQIAFQLMRPARRKYPSRYVIRVRCLFLGPLIAQGSPLDWMARTTQWLATLGAMDVNFRDRASERWFGG